MEKEEILKRLNEFTRREMSEDEVYIFDVILCDNDIDRDGERFSQNALESLKKLFVGKTGIFDHNPKSGGQTARIFSTELVTDNTKATKNGELYTYLKGRAYMVRTDSNSGLIREIDGGIKKEVSISCSAGSKKCSVCGTDLKRKGCPHVMGKKYSGKTAHAVLDDISDAYEWSFVAVPAQVNAGVTKRFGRSADSAEAKAYSEELMEKLCKSVRTDIYKLCLASGSSVCAKALSAAADKMNAEELIEFKELLEREHKSKTVSQLDIKKDCLDDFRMGAKKNEY